MWALAGQGKDTKFFQACLAPADENGGRVLLCLDFALAWGIPVWAAEDDFGREGTRQATGRRVGTGHRTGQGGGTPYIGAGYCDLAILVVAERNMYCLGKASVIPIPIPFPNRSSLLSMFCQANKLTTRPERILFMYVVPLGLVVHPGPDLTPPN